MKSYIAAIVFLSFAISAFASIADFNGDHKVNMLDFSTFSTAWGLQSGETNYNADCDIALTDNTVSVADLWVFAENWLVNEVVLDIYNNGWGNHCETVLLKDEGTFNFVFSDEMSPYMPSYYQYSHYSYAQREGYYTELIDLETEIVGGGTPDDYIYSTTANIDLDPVVPDKFNGTMFLTSIFFRDGYIFNVQVDVFDYQPSEYDHSSQSLFAFMTDEQGRFAIDIEPGSYWVRFNEPFGESGRTQVQEFHVSGDYQDYKYRALAQAMKPNIYIYPEVSTDLTVKVDFPSGGDVVISEPLYQNGWEVTVEPSGLIDGQYDFLFYESVQPDLSQYDSGWVVEQSELEAFFRNNMQLTGFNDAEIEDFIEYWIPLFNESPYYAICPQYNEQLNSMALLDLSVEPQNLIRLWYCVRGVPDDSLSLSEPQIPAFSREGFTVAEWGVILK